MRAFDSRIKLMMEKEVTQRVRAKSTWGYMCIPLAQRPLRGPNHHNEHFPANPWDHTLHGSFILSKPPTAFPLAWELVGPGDRKEHNVTFPGLMPLRMGLCLPPQCWWIVSGTGSDTHRTRTVPKGTQSYTTALVTAWKTLSSAATFNTHNEMVFKNITNIFLYYLTSW